MINERYPTRGPATGIAGLIAGILIAVIALQLAGSFNVMDYIPAGVAPVSPSARSVLPTAVVSALVIPTSIPQVLSANPAVIPQAQPTAAPVAVPECVLTTWPNGSQSCNDGRAIDMAHGQAGFCNVTTWGDGSRSCDNGLPAGIIVEPNLQPTPPPWPEAPTANVTWQVADGPNGNTCVTVTFSDGQTQTACSEPNVQLSPATAAFVARMIEDGKIEQGRGTPRG